MPDKTQANYVTRVGEILQDEEGTISADTVKTNLTGAVAEYQRRRPNREVEDVAGDGTTYTHDLPTNWEEGFSWIMAIEYPIRETGKPCYLPQSYFNLYNTSSGLKIRTYIPFASGQTAGINFSKKHIISDVSVTVPDSDFEAVCNLTAGICCSQLARYYAQTARATIGADVVDYWERATHYSSQKDQLNTLYDSMVPDEGGAIGEWDISPRINRGFIFDRKNDEINYPYDQ